MNPRILSLIFIPLLLTACASGPAGRGGPGGGRGDDTNGPPGSMGSGASKVVDQIQEQLQVTGEALKLAPKQAILWDAYVEKISALMADQMKLPTYRPKQTATQQIADKVDTVRNRLTAMEEIQEAASRLYGSLDESQRKTADQMLPGTLPALYSGLGSAGGGGPGGGERNGSGRNGPDGGMRGPGGGMGGGFGRM